MHGVPYDRRGFTLIELLVVMAVIAIFLGVLGMAFTRNNPTVATQAGQRTVAGLITGARAQAILKQQPVRLIVHNDPPDAGDPETLRREKRERYLRYLAIVTLTRNEQTGDLEWVPVNDGVFLPRGVYIVPPRQYVLPDGSVVNPPPEVISDDDTDWRHARRSVVARVRDHIGGNPDDGETDDYIVQSNLPAPNNEQNFFHIEFNSRGMIVGDPFPPSAEGRLVVAPARETPTTPVFEDGSDNYVLGGVLRRYGSITLVHQAEGFPEIIP